MVFVFGAKAKGDAFHEELFAAPGVGFGLAFCVWVAVLSIVMCFRLIGIDQDSRGVEFELCKGKAPCFLISLSIYITMELGPSSC